MLDARNKLFLARRQAITEYFSPKREEGTYQKRAPFSAGIIYV
jgi:hypothetical protein